MAHILHSSFVYQLAPIYGRKPVKVIDDEMRARKSKIVYNIALVLLLGL